MLSHYSLLKVFPFPRPRDVFAGAVLHRFVRTQWITSAITLGLPEAFLGIQLVWSLLSSYRH